MHNIPASPSEITALVPARVVRAELGGISDMTLWRWLRRPDLNFPQPILIARRRYWRRADIDAWKQSLIPLKKRAPGELNDDMCGLNETASR